MTLKTHICFTCDKYISCGNMYSEQVGAYLIGDCIDYVGKNSGERKTCKYYIRANDKTIKNRENELERTNKLFREVL